MTIFYHLETVFALSILLHLCIAFKPLRSSVFLEMDTNGNGLVSREEALIWALGQGNDQENALEFVDELFKNMDGNEDGQIDMAEARQFSAAGKIELHRRRMKMEPEMEETEAK